MIKKRTITKHLVTHAIKKKSYTLLAINIDGFTPEGVSPMFMGQQNI